VLVAPTRRGRRAAEPVFEAGQEAYDRGGAAQRKGEGVRGQRGRWRRPRVDDGFGEGVAALAEGAVSAANGRDQRARRGQADQDRAGGPVAVDGRMLAGEKPLEPGDRRFH